MIFPNRLEDWGRDIPVSEIVAEIERRGWTVEETATKDFSGGAAWKVWLTTDTRCLRGESSDRMGLYNGLIRSATSRSGGMA